MPDAFIIMQIGDPALETVCGQAIVPALEACGFEPKRVDKHSEGGLLKSEIIGFIERSEIIIADLTNERPNCYLEIGYAMGLGKFRNLILTVREDHRLESLNHVRGGARIHFDLSGYDILPWSGENLQEFRQELEKRIRRRMAITAPIRGVPPPVLDSEWIKEQREKALNGLQASRSTAFMEVRFALDSPKPVFSPQELDQAAQDAPIETFGWPIGVYLRNRDEFRPYPRADGIVATIASDRGSFDYWALRRNGDFYLLASLFEDQRDPERIFFDTRIVRVTEALLYCARLYTRLGILPDATLVLAVRHGGLRGRQIGTASPYRSITGRRPSAEDEMDAEVRSSVQGIEADLVPLVRTLLEPMFAVFDLFSVPEPVYADIVNAFVQGRVT